TMLGHNGSSVATPHVIKHHPFGPGAKTAKTSTTPASASKKHAATKTKTATVAPPVRTAPKRPSPVTAALAAGLPAPVAAALGQHSTVVVALYNPYSEVDGIAFAEARAGASLAGVGFVPLNVLSKPQVGKLTETLGLLPDPGLLVYVRPGRRPVRRDPQGRRLRRLVRRRGRGLPGGGAQRGALTPRAVQVCRRPPGNGLHDRGGRGPDGPRLRRPRPVTSQNPAASRP